MNTLLVGISLTPIPLLLIAGSLFRRNWQQRIEDVRTALVFGVYTSFAAIVQALIVRHTPSTMDPQLLAADMRLGFPTLDIWHWVVRHYLVFNLLALVYVMLPSMIALTWLIEQDKIVRTACVIAGVFCFIGYAYFPAVGPYHYNWSIQLASSTPRNCWPSMHLTWALLLPMMARDRRLKVALWLYAPLVAVATIGVGEHYFVDLLAAVPYSLAVFRAAQMCQNYFFPAAPQIIPDPRVSGD